MFEKVSRSLKYDSNIFFGHKHTYRRRWLLSVGAYSFSQQENERLTANMRLIGIPLITMGGVIIINAIACEALTNIL